MSLQCTCHEARVPFPSAHRRPGRWQQPSQNTSTPTSKAGSTTGQHELEKVGKRFKFTKFFPDVIPLSPPFSLQMSGEDHRRPDDVFPCRHHADLHGQPQRPGAQLPAGQHLQDRPLPAKSKAALQVSWAVPAVFRELSCFSLTSYLRVCTVIHPRATPTPETSGSTCRRCSSTCRERLKSTLRPRTTTLDCSSIRSGFRGGIHHHREISILFMINSYNL